MKGIRVNNGWNRAELQVEGDTPSTQLALLRYRALEDQTALSVFGQVALSIEPTTTAGATSSLAGFIRIKIVRHGGTANVVIPSGEWNEPFDVSDAGTPPTDDIRDYTDVGETWAIVPFAISGSTGSGSNQLVVLAPKTKRKLTRGDLVVIDMNYSNAASGNAVLHWSACGVLVSAS